MRLAKVMSSSTMRKIWSPDLMFARSSVMSLGRGVSRP